MASEVIEAVLGALNQNVLWVKDKSNPSAPPTKDITAVDPLEWHGLMLTLSHLLYRRSPPAENLSDIIHALLMGLSFEKRNPAGGSIGSNVRDASCFGIWALARRYTTFELLQVQTKSVLVARGHDPTASILQVVATELVVTASLDPAGNIRRGASAALQELKKGQQMHFSAGTYLETSKSHVQTLRQLERDRPPAFHASMPRLHENSRYGLSYIICIWLTSLCSGDDSSLSAASASTSIFQIIDIHGMTKD